MSGVAIWYTSSPLVLNYSEFQASHFSALKLSFFCFEKNKLTVKNYQIQHEYDACRSGAANEEIRLLHRDGPVEFEK
jgi:hypothetical protein